MSQNSFGFAERSGVSVQCPVFIQMALEQIHKLEQVNNPDAFILVSEMKQYVRIFESWKSNRPTEDDRGNIVSDFVSKATESMKFVTDITQKKLDSNRPV